MKISDEDILNALGSGTREEQAARVHLSTRHFKRRVAKLKEAGRLNLDGSLPENFPGAGREITKITTSLDKDGEITSQSIQEKVALGEQEPKIDGPIVRQSRYTGRDGEVIGQWDIRVPRKHENAEKNLVEGFLEEIKPLPPQEQLDIEHDSHLLNHYTLSDCHLGLMVDEDFSSDLPSTEDLIAKSFERMVQDSPSAENCVICILGDWFHFDGLLPVTPASGNVLFSSAHYGDMVKSGVKIMRRLISAALYHHKHVTVVICEGNHDLASSMWLRIMMMGLYEAESRVSFVDSDTPFYAMQFGSFLLGYHHGHIKGLRKPEELVLLFADDYAQEWGNTKKRYIHTGHLHHVDEKQVTGAIVTQHPTLAGKDNHSKRQGYRAYRAAVADTYSEKYGKVGETIITPEMLLR